MSTRAIKTDGRLAEKRTDSIFGSARRKLQPSKAAKAKIRAAIASALRLAAPPAE
jgi:hypothetical protein